MSIQVPTYDMFPSWNMSISVGCDGACCADASTPDECEIADAAYACSMQASAV